MHYQMWRLLVTALASSVVMLPPTVRAQDTVDRLTAFALATNQPGTIASAPVDILILRWSTEAEQAQLVNALLTGGSREMEKVLGDLPRAAILRPSNSLGIEFQFAGRQIGENGTERIVLISLVPVSFWKTPSRADIDQYPFTTVELQLIANGTGEGKLSIFTRAYVDKNHKAIVMQDYEPQPILLQNVKRESSPH